VEELAERLLGKGKYVGQSTDELMKLLRG